MTSKKKLRINLNFKKMFCARCKCVICGGDFDEVEWEHDPEVLEMCRKCLNLRSMVRGMGIESQNYWWPDVYDAPTSIVGKLQQLSTVILLLESTQCRSNLIR